MGLYEINLLIYNLSILPVIFFSLFFYTLLFSKVTLKMPSLKFKKRVTDWPFVTIQLPVYNDPVIERCIRSCLRLDYPKNKLQIIVADDSTDAITMGVVDKFKGKVDILRRKNRNGFKAGALNNALNYTKGDIIVLFDSDWIPPRNFLKRIVKPFLVDKKIAAVQGKMKYINPYMNIVTKFATSLMSVFYNVWVPVQNFIGCPFFGGTCGAVRKDVLIEVGGWNENSLTEDADLSIRILKRGYKIVFLENLKSAGELPYTLLSFLKQQGRWAYGQTRVFVEFWKDIFFNKSFNLLQRIILTFTTFGYVCAPFVVIMVITGQLGWILGTPKPFEISDFIKFVSVFMYTSGFLVVAVYSIKREDLNIGTFSIIFASLTIGVVLAITNSISFVRALLGLRTAWFRTPKWGSIKIMEIFKRFAIRR
jgi:cellulose synthase/poly-beta-1,6-N-acetylglucosamine synthase-like glycosyltransferase